MKLANLIRLLSTFLAWPMKLLKLQPTKLEPRPVKLQPRRRLRRRTIHDQGGDTGN